MSINKLQELINSKIIQENEINKIGKKFKFIKEDSMNFKIELMQKLKTKQDYNNLSKLILYFIENNHKNVYFEINNQISNMITFNKYNSLEKILKEQISTKKVKPFFESINKFIEIKFHENQDICFNLINSLIEEDFDIPQNNWLSYLNLIFESNDNTLIFKYCKIFKIKVKLNLTKSLLIQHFGEIFSINFIQQIQ